MTTPGNQVAVIQDEYGTGLEDFDEGAAVPRINIAHANGTFKDSLTGEEFAEIYAVPLGMVKQRVLWADEVDNGAKPQCKSQDGKTGYPNMGDKAEDRFPWDKAPGLDPNTQPKDEHGRVLIACEGCPMAAWGPKTPAGKAVPPPCRERHTYPVHYNREPSTKPPFLETGILSFQGSGIKPSRQYLAGFARARKPTYSAVVRITLEMFKRGSVTYSVPVFAKVADLPIEEWEPFARELAPMREFLTQAPRAGDDSDPAKGGGQTAAQAMANVVATATVGVATPTQVAEPVSTPVAQPAAAPASTAAPVAAPAATPAQSVVNQATAQTVDAEIVDDDEDLPF